MKGQSGIPLQPLSFLQQCRCRNCRKTRLLPNAARFSFFLTYQSIVHILWIMWAEWQAGGSLLRLAVGWISRGRRL